ncbi:MAG: phosphoadenylyl-sulfate reductase [Prolixibacteraceae bacterium]|jgi:phosphoadenosine phosphosulfate reductase|nr:phosphoadenylyl-sulfate reductase [Prolixibacteraceae bacterium]MBT6764029.1 phosphoadenylyl-sulfate reductase [Prolixibacteraceae bacterium]MBT6999530.1 phosphoadenylyl-sulfate reductase [Prolixibacteraceae bacterium]MBT7395920.1 phosphoadenylyl-sulfate reductase [Prolixibacteraceae bacterium]
MQGKQLTEKYNTQFSERTIVEKIQVLVENHAGKVIFTTSFGYEDQVISDIIFKNNLDAKVVTLDTGRLFPETYKVFRSTLEKYKKPIKVYFPPTNEVEKLLDEKGPFSFYESVENRKECCFIRKVIPLKRALSGNEIWITGIRSSQSDNRSEMQEFEWDPVNEIVKFNPLMGWSIERTIEYIKENHVPYNVLHDKGFVSIGCEPCTRAIRQGEDIRAGRWWWERSSNKECGLHSFE